MIDGPPSDAGAAHDRITWASPVFAVSPVGAPGAAVIRSELWFAVNMGTPAALPPAITTGQPSIIAARNVPASVLRIPRPGRLVQLKGLDSSALRPPETSFI